jgi:hypothetical protein
LASHIFDELKTVIAASGAGSSFDLAVAGWSETSGPSAYFVCNRENQGPIKPQIIDAGPDNIAPHDEAIKAELKRAFPDGIDPERFDPLVDGLRILEIQRHHKVAHPSDSTFVDAVGVGGFAQLTTIRRDEITMKIIRRWADEIGRPLAIG